MAFLLTLLIYVATFLITELLRPKPNIENAKPAGLGDFQVPTATEGRVVPIIWGRVKTSGPNVVWYGDLVADPITEKIKTGLFSSETVTQGFRYSIGLQMALCRGPVDLLINIRNDESFAWGEDAPSGDANVVPTDIGAAYTIDEPNFFGGEEAGGGGGLTGSGRIFPGNETQAISAYLQPFQIPTPAYRGTCYITWERGGIGLGPQIRPFEFELERIPDGLDLATLQPGDEEVNGGANPMNVIFEVLTNSEWGLNKGAGVINVAGMRTIAATLKTEGQGFAWIWDRTLDVLEVVRLIEEQVDGVLFLDPVSGSFDFKLIRFDYTPGTLPLLDETNIVKVNRFARPAWADTTNNITTEFTDRRKNYTTSFALAQDMANIEIVQALNTGAVKYPGVKDPTLANDLAWRELRALSFPMATGQMVTDRTQWDLVPGDVREWSWGRLGLDRLPIRIIKVDRGKILKNEIRVDFAQDIFSIAPGTFTAPIDTGWVPVSSEAQPSLRERLWEVPFQLSLDNERHLAVICSRDGGLHISFDVFSDRSDPGMGVDLFEGSEADFTPTAQITAAIFRDKGDVTPFTVDITIDGLNDTTVAELTLAGSITVNANNPSNVFLIDEELFYYETVVDLGGGLVTLEECHAGTFDTVPADHADDSVVWFIGQGLGLLQREGPLPTPPGAIDVKILPTTIRNTLDIGSAATLSATVGSRIRAPIPPGDPFMNGNRFHDLDGWTRAVGTLNFTWNTRNKETQDFDVKQDDADIQQSGDVGAHVIVRRVDTSATVVDFDNIFSDQFITTDFLPQASPGIPDELDFTAEISNKTTANIESQIVTSREFEVFGFGIDFGADFGGEAPNNGIVLDAGAPPFVPEPVPGSGEDRAWTVSFLGALNPGEGRRFIFSLTDNLNRQSVLGFTLPLDQGGDILTLDDYADAFRAGVQTAVDFTDPPMPFTVTREGAVVTVTTRFGDFSMFMQNRAAALFVSAASRSPMFVTQEAAPPATPEKQVFFMDWFESGTLPNGSVDTRNDVLSPTNSIAFATGSAIPNQNRVFVLAATWEQRQDLATFENGLIDIGGVDDGVDTSRTQQIPAFYQQILNQPSFSILESVEGPLAFRGGLDFPMQRSGIVITLKDNFQIREQTVATAVDGRGPAFAGGVVGPGGFKFIPKVGFAGKLGLPTGLTHVVNTQVSNDDSAIGVELSFTLDGTVFTETLGPFATLPDRGSNVRNAWNLLMDAIDDDARFSVVNRFDGETLISVGAQIIWSTPAVSFTAHSDVGIGLRVEFADISP